MLTFLIVLESIILFIPVSISALIEKKSLKTEFKEIGFSRSSKSIFDTFLKFILGLDIGIFLYLLRGYFLFFYKDILITNLFGIEFVKQGVTNIINTEPIQPDPLEITLIIILRTLITSPSEEGFFRGFLIQKSNLKLKMRYIVIISSTFFTVYHLPPFLVPIQSIITYFGYFFLLGFLFAIIFIYSNRSLIVCIIAHSVFNILILVI